MSALDEAIGRVRKRLQEPDLHCNTMLWFSSDNGPQKGEPGSSTANHVPGNRSCDRTLNSVLHTSVCNIYYAHFSCIEEWHTTMADDSVWSRCTMATHPLSP